MKSPSMFRGLLSFSSMTMVSRVFGLLRDMAISSVFGANAATDAFWVAFRIPNLMRRLFCITRHATAYASSRIFALRRLLWRAALFLWIKPRAA